MTSKSTDIVFAKFRFGNFPIGMGAVVAGKNDFFFCVFNQTKIRGNRKIRLNKALRVDREMF